MSKEDELEDVQRRQCGDAPNSTSDGGRGRTIQMRAAVEQNGKSGGAMDVCLILIITVSKMRLSCCNATLLSATV